MSSTLSLGGPTATGGWSMVSLPEIRQLIVPPILTAGVPGIGGKLRTVPEDFRVREIPKFRPGPAHAAFLLWKKGRTTEAAIHEIARQLDIPAPEIGHAGRKDKDAVTEQWLSMPARFRERLGRFQHPNMRLGEVRPCGQKLKPGDHGGNEFEIVVRNIAIGSPEPLDRVKRKLACLRAVGGFHNLFGPQAFDRTGKLALQGITALSGEHSHAMKRHAVGQAQAVLFHSYLLIRFAHGFLRTVQVGDLLQRPGARLPFVCEEPSVDQARLDRGEICLTGPLFGPRMPSPPSETVPADLELEILARCGIPREAARKRIPLPGSRRPLQIPIPEVMVDHAEAETVAGDSSSIEPAIHLRFTLPPGCYATVLLRELQG